MPGHRIMATVPHPAMSSPRAPSAAERRLSPELLDTLPADAPAAVRSRRDLRRLNALMGNFAWFERVLRDRVGPDEKILELGAGDGALARRLARASFRVDAVDRTPRPGGLPDPLTWHQADVTTFADWPRYPVVIANLFLHHFDADELRRIGAQLDRHARFIAACEPLRSPATRVLFATACALIGAGPVTRHDGRVSIEAGFCGDELADALGLRPSRWRWCVDTTFRGAHRLLALRQSTP